MRSEPSHRYPGTGVNLGGVRTPDSRSPDSRGTPRPCPPLRAGDRAGYRVSGLDRETRRAHHRIRPGPNTPGSQRRPRAALASTEPGPVSGRVGATGAVRSEWTLRPFDPQLRGCGFRSRARRGLGRRQKAHLERHHRDVCMLEFAHRIGDLVAGVVVEQTVPQAAVQPMG